MRYCLVAPKTPEVVLLAFLSVYLSSPMGAHGCVFASGWRVH